MNILAMETMSAVKTVSREIITATVPRGRTFGSSVLISIGSIVRMVI